MAGETTYLAQANGTYLLQQYLQGDLITSEVTHLPTNLTARGHAKRNPIDIYDQEIGLQISKNRAFERLFPKITRFIVNKGVRSYDNA